MLVFKSFKFYHVVGQPLTFTFGSFEFNSWTAQIYTSTQCCKQLATYAPFCSIVAMLQSRGCYGSGVDRILLFFYGSGFFYAIFLRFEILFPLNS